MCGIAGQIVWAGQNDRTIVEKMTSSLAHRGPDASGVIEIPPAVLGHRRLSVIDTRTIANQPFADGSGRFHIVYNGEVYNFPEIRRELEACGVHFVTNSDTEVVLESYVKWGPACLQRFNGMFAMAIWDRKHRRLFLARDRLGKKPLFFAELANRNSVIFASELKALVGVPGVGKNLSRRALSQFLSLGYILTSDCIIDGVHKLPPAHYMIVEEGKPLTPVCYWDLASCYRDKTAFRDEREAAEALGVLLDDAVKLRLVSDVPLGAFLSGGIDSSAIVASMCQSKPPAEVRTFSIGFSERGFDERSEARAVSNMMGVSHRDQVVGDEIRDLFSSIFYSADEPFADTSIIPTFALAQMTREHVVVALSGDGGDELFAGYETYIADKLRSGLFSHLPRPVFGAIGSIFSKLVPPSMGKVSFEEKVRRFLASASQDPVTAHASWRGYFSGEEISQILPSDFSSEDLVAASIGEFKKIDDQVSGCDLIDRMTYLDIKTWLVDDILVKVDRATMAHSLEVRAPFLDFRMVEFAASLPSAMKLKGFNKKHILKKSQAGRLPKSVTYRKKAGFSAPVGRWLSRPGQGLFSNVTPDDLAGDLFNGGEVKRICEDHWAGKADNGYKLFSLMAFYYWKQGLAAH